MHQRINLLVVPTKRNKLHDARPQGFLSPAVTKQNKTPRQHEESVKKSRDNKSVYCRKKKLPFPISNTIELLA